MIYLDNGATSFHKPPQVIHAMRRAIATCASPGRGGYEAAQKAAQCVFLCRERAAQMFACQPEEVVFTSNCTHGLNIAIRTLVRPGARVVISGFEHNAVTRPLYSLGAEVRVAGRKLFDESDTLESFEKALKSGCDAAIFTHVSNVFGYILPVAEMASLCRRYGVPFAVDAAQSAGLLPISARSWGADFIAMPGHKGLLGPQGTGILICGDRTAKPLIYGGTGSYSRDREMPRFLPDRLEVGTHNVPGIAGLEAGMCYLAEHGSEALAEKERAQACACAKMLEDLGFRVYCGQAQLATVSFVPDEDCEIFAERLAQMGIAVRAGLHCAPLAHESAGTIETGTVRVSYGMDASQKQTDALRCAVSKLSARRR